MFIHLFFLGCDSFAAANNTLKSKRLGSHVLDSSGHHFSSVSFNKRSQAPRQFQQNNSTLQPFRTHQHGKGRGVPVAARSLAAMKTSPLKI